MIGRKICTQIAASAAISGMIFMGFADTAGAAGTISNGNIDGIIRAGSPSYRYRNPSGTGSSFQRVLGEEYTFNAQQGDSIQISAQSGNNSNLSPVLVLISSQTGRQVAYSDTGSSLQYQVPSTGEYRLLVLSRNNSTGSYTLSVSGLNGETGTQSQTNPDQVMSNVLKLKEIGCGVPNVAQINIGSEQRCTRDIEAGQYTYDPASRSIRQSDSASGQTSTTDDNRRLLQSQYGLNVLGSCPADRSSVVAVSFPNSGQTCCATPNRVFSAGQYTYNTATGNLDSGRKQCNVQLAGVCVVK
jgi:YD repeat-containing protein